MNGTAGKAPSDNVGSSAVIRGWQQLCETLADVLDQGSDERVHALLIFRISGFEKLYGVLGHTEASRVLVNVGAAIRGCLRQRDWVIPLGVGEFGLVLPELANEQLIKLAANKLTTAVNETLAASLDAGILSGSIGAAAFPRHGGDSAALIKLASLNAYLASQRRAQVVFEDAEESHGLLNRFALERELREAFDADQMRIFLQPQLDLNSNRIHSAEALIRWQHPERGFVSPGQFLPLASDLGLMRRLSEWVVQQVLRLQAEMPIAIDVAINLSPDLMSDDSMADFLVENLALWSVAPQRIVVEITEEAIVTDPAHCFAMLERLRGLGCGISLDDFGTGYSSLSHVSHFPLTELKIDQSFIRDLCSNHKHQLIVRSIMQLARNFDLETVAEGVEDAATLELLRSLGLHKVQGFHIARPMPEADFLTAAATWS